MLYMRKMLSLTLAAVMFLTALTGCSYNFTIGGEEPDPTPQVNHPAPVPNANGELTFGGQTFSVDTDRLTLQLQVRSNEVLDLSPLAWCTQLRYLSVNLTVVPHIYYDNFKEPHITELMPADLSPLAGLSNLEHLELNVSKIKDLVPLAQLPQLSSLVLWIDGEVDLTPLVSCPSLVNLSLGGRGTVDLAPLARCGSLAGLRVDVYDSDWNSPDLSALSGAPALQVLSLGASNGLSELVNVPLRSVQDLNDSGDILENLPKLESLELVEFSDERLNDITPLLMHPGVTQIKLEVGAQEIENFTVIQSADDPLLNQLITAIPIAQLKNFLTRKGTAITLVVDRNRTAGANNAK